MGRVAAWSGRYLSIHPVALRGGPALPLQRAELNKPLNVRCLQSWSNSDSLCTIA